MARLGRGLALPSSIGATEPPRTDAELLQRGFLIQVANPKALLFFGGLLAGAGVGLALTGRR